MNRWFAFILAAILGSTFLLAHFQLAEKGLMISTTTSLYDTGLLENLRATYREKYGLDLHFIPTGSGQALQYARRGDVDVVLTHSPPLEFQFLRENLGGVRRIIAYNFFTIVGPPEDPASIAGLSPPEALGKIAQAKAKWISRGDGSGTHMKEKELWGYAGFDLNELGRTAWYIQAGAGMGATLQMANQMRGYTLADLGTYLKYRHENLVDLEAFIGQSKELINVYSVLAVNPALHPKVKFEEAVRFIRFLVSEEGQTLIGSFGKEELGRPLFHPAVELLAENLDPEIAGWIREYAFLGGNECPPQHRLGQEDLF